MRVVNRTLQVPEGSKACLCGGDFRHHDTFCHHSQWSTYYALDSRLGGRGRGIHLHRILLMKHVVEKTQVTYLCHYNTGRGLIASLQVEHAVRVPKKVLFPPRMRKSLHGRGGIPNGL